MLRTFWRRSASQALRRLQASLRSDGAGPALRPLRVAVVGVGQELNGDDAAGVLVAQALSKRQRAGSSDARRPVSVSLLVVEAAHAPENCTGPIRRFAPDLVILVDAAETGDLPGTVRWLAWQDTGGLGGSTHTLPPFMLARFLATELSCEVALIGIQRQNTSFGVPVSAPVRKGIRSVAQGLVSLLLGPTISESTSFRR